MNNNFVIKNDKISHFECFNQASYTKFVIWTLKLTLSI